MLSHESACRGRIDAAASRVGIHVPTRAAGVSGRRRGATSGGFTLVELLLAVAIILTLFAVSAPAYSRALHAAKITRAIADVRALSTDVLAYSLTFDELPLTLADLGKGDLRDPWGYPYQYLNFATAGGGDGGGRGRGRGGGPPPSGARKDKFLVPINSRYDLYSLGEDGVSIPPLPAQPSWDDIVMAGDGAFIGLATEF